MVVGVLLPCCGVMSGVFLGYNCFVPALLLGTLCFARGKRHCAVSANELLLKDQRPPVLYLRSFEAEAVTRRTFRWWWLISPAWLWDLTSEEEYLAKALNVIGPTIAIGKPGEELPELGAARLYVGHNEWRQTVKSYSERSKLVVLRLGETPGFWWELENALKTLRPENLLLIVPFNREQYDAFCARAKDHFVHPLPKYVDSRKLLRGTKSLRGMIYFKPDWTPVYIDLRSVVVPWKFTIRTLAKKWLLRKLIFGLRPVVEEVAPPWRPPSLLPRIVFYQVAALLIVPFGQIFMLTLLWPELREQIGTFLERKLARAFFALNCLIVFTVLIGILLHHVSRR